MHVLYVYHDVCTIFQIPVPTLEVAHTVFAFCLVRASRPNTINKAAFLLANRRSPSCSSERMCGTRLHAHEPRLQYVRTRMQARTQLSPRSVSWPRVLSVFECSLGYSKRWSAVKPCGIKLLKSNLVRIHKVQSTFQHETPFCTSCLLQTWEEKKNPNLLDDCFRLHETPYRVKYGHSYNFDHLCFRGKSNTEVKQNERSQVVLLSRAAEHLASGRTV